jgi:creatinine amidohydrolase
MPSRPYILSETTWKTVRETRIEAAVLPWGATEAHNVHLPYGTDTIQCEHIAAEAAKVAWEMGARVLVLPAVPFGVNTGQLDIRGDINMMPSTQLAVLRDVAESLRRQGFRKLVVLNGHGGNEFKPMVRELQPRFPDLFFCLVNWYAILPMKDFFEDTGEHGSEMETSNLLVIAPEFVLPLSEAGEGRLRPFRLKGLRDGTAWAPREWSRATADTGIGNPAKASAEKGGLYLDALARRIGLFLAELSDADPALLYETGRG